MRGLKKIAWQGDRAQIYMCIYKLTSRLLERIGLRVDSVKISSFLACLTSYIIKEKCFKDRIPKREKTRHFCQYFVFFFQVVSSLI